MCEYCRLNNGVEGEFHSLKMLFDMEDGHQVFELYMNRYICNGKHDASLILDYGFKKADNAMVESIKHESIKIKYCPFCGEEL